VSVSQRLDWCAEEYGTTADELQPVADRLGRLDLLSVRDANPAHVNGRPTFARKARPDDRLSPAEVITAALRTQTSESSDRCGNLVPAPGRLVVVRFCSLRDLNRALFDTR
jgi:hypothetical protein